MMFLIDFATQIESPHERHNMQASVRRLCDFLGRPAMFTDFRRDTLDEMKQWSATRYKPATARAYCRRLRRLWRRAFASGLVGEDAPKSERPHRTPPAITPIWEAESKLINLRDVSLLRDFVVSFYIPLTGEKAIRTLRLYENSIRHLERNLGRPALVEDLNDDTLARHHAARLAAGVSAVSANREMHKLLAFGRLAFRKRLLSEWPVVAFAREPRREPAAWLEGELKRLWQSIDALQGQIAGIPANLWWRALHEVIWWTAERITPLLELRWEHVDLDAGWVLFLAETRKGRTGDVRRKLPPSAVKALHAIREPERDLVFPWDRSLSLLWPRYKRILKAAGLPTDRRSMFHRIRRSTASHYAAAGGDPVRLLDHSSPKVTKAYIDQRIATVEQPADLLFSPG